MDNNFLFYDLPDPAAEKKRRFMKAQNRVAIMLLISFGITIGCSVIIAFAYRMFPHMTENEIGYQVVQTMMYLSYIALPALTFGIISGKKLRSYFTFSAGGKNRAAVFFAALGVIYFAQLVAALLSTVLGYAGLSEPYEYDTAFDLTTFIIRFITIAVLPAIFEELMMRGVVLGELLPYGKGFAIIASGVLFGLMHMSAVQLPFACIAGIAMAFAAVYTGSLLTSILLHFTNNLISVVLLSLPALVGAEWAVFIEAALSTLIFLCGAAAAVYLIKNKDEKPDGKRKALCVSVYEADRVDLRDFSPKNVSPLLYVYAAIAVVMAIYSLIAQVITL